ncbi:MAG TPA: LptF/LptG family permease [Bacteroidia bacterium]|nr:LptF/LptG family permease [Bacteroidia bacterium]
MFKFIPILDRYILKKFIGTFVFSILLIICIVIVFDISEKIEDFLTHDVPLHEIVFDYYLNFIPYFINLFAYLFTFIAVIFFTSRMAARTEIVAILSGGVSFYRLLRPYMIGAALIAGLSLYLGNYLIPQASKTRLEFESRYIGSHYVNQDHNIHRQIAPGAFIYMERYDSEENVGTRFTLEKFDGLKMTMKISAREIRWDSLQSRWSIIDYSGRFIKGEKERLFKGTRIDTVINLSPKDFSRAQNVMESMNSSELAEYIRNEKTKGSDSVHLYEIEQHRRLAFPFATFIMTLIGVAVSSRKVRGGIGMQLAIGISIGFTFIVFMQLFTSYASSGVMPAYIAVWIPNAIFAVIAIFMIRKAPK